MNSLGFVPSKGDPEALMREAMTEDGHEYWKYLLLYIDKSNLTLGELVSTGILETLSEFLDENTLSTDSGEMKTKRVRFLCDNKNPCKIAHTT